MAMLDGFMRPNYGSDPGILGLYQFVQSGYDAGKARAQNDALRQYAKAAYTDTGDAQKQDIANAIGADPRAGYQLAGMAQQQQAAQQAQQLAQFQRVGKAASAIIAAKQRGDETTAEGIYQAIVPELGLMSAQHGGPTPPPNLNAADMGALYKVAAMYSQLPQPDKPIAVGADSTLIDPNTHKVIYQGQGDAGAAVPGMTFNGMPVFRDRLGNLKDIRGNPIPSQGGSNGASMASPVSGSVAGTAPQAPNIGQPADPSLIDGNVPQGTQVTQATGPDGTRVMFAMAPDTPDAVKMQTAAAAGVPQPQGQPQATGLQYKPSGAAANPLTQRLQNLRQIETQFGMKLSPQQEQAFVLNGGKLDPSDFSPDGADPLASLSAPDRALVDKLAHYELLPSDLGRGKDRQKMLAMAALVNPDYNVSNAQAANAFLKDLARSSPTSAGGQVTSLNQMMEHLNLMMNANEKMPGDSRFPLVNKITNSLTTGTGGAQVNNWNQGVAYLNQEIAKLLKGGVASESEVSELMSHLNAAGSPEQRRQALGRVAEFVYGRIAALTDRRDSLLGAMSPGTSLLTSSSEQALMRAYKLAGDQPPELLPANNGTPFAQRGGQQAPQSPAGWSIQEVQQ